MSQELHGWKAIADHLGTSVRNAQRWEAELDLPVRRLAASRGASVYADPEELERWRREREPVTGPEVPGDEDSVPPPAQSYPHGATRRLALLAACAVVIGAVAWWQLHGRGGDATRPPTVAPSLGGVVVFDVRVGDETARVGTPNGHGFTLRLGDGSTYGFAPSIRPGASTLAVTQITADATSGADRVVEVARLPMTRRQTVGGLPVPVPLEILWDSVLDELAGDLAQARCCVSCDDLTLCTLTMQSPCGRCSAEPPVAATPSAGSPDSPAR
jgi:hypothetical protein